MPIEQAYAKGIFPWYSERMPILWHCPDPRFVLEPKQLHVPKSLRKQMKRGVYEVKLDTAFERASTAKAQQYFEFQVVKAAKPVASNPSPRYPDMLRTANIKSVPTPCWRAREARGARVRRAALGDDLHPCRRLKRRQHAAQLRVDGSRESIVADSRAR